MIRAVIIVFGCGMVVFAAEKDGGAFDAKDRISCQDPCGMTGTWKNELGSEMQISCQADASPTSVGTLIGQYKSKVGQAFEWYQLSGRYTMIGSDCTVGWSVAWNNENGNSKSTTSWTGVHYESDQSITTFWILTSYTSRKDMWGNSRIGKDVFTKK